MAQNYLRFAFSVPIYNEQQRRWMETALLQTYAFYNVTDYRVRDNLKREHPWIKVFCNHEIMGFEYNFERGINLEVPWKILFYADENGNPEQLCTLLQAFLKENKRLDGIGFEWASYCDKSREDEFGGGAVYITAEKERWQTTNDWLAGARTAHMKKVHKKFGKIAKSKIRGLLR